MGGELKGGIFCTGIGDVHVGRDLPLTVEEVKALRLSVGWSVRGNYERILNEALFTVSAKRGQVLVGHLQVLGSPGGDVLIHDVCMRPEMQQQRGQDEDDGNGFRGVIGDGSSGVTVLFDEENLPVFQRFGITILRGGCLDMVSLSTTGIEKEDPRLDSTK